MFESGLLILTRPIPVLRKNIQHILSQAAKVISNTLYVHIQPTQALKPDSNPEPVFTSLRFVPPNKGLQKLMTDIYSSSAAVCGNIDIYVLQGNITNVGNEKLCYNLRSKLDVILMDNQEQLNTNEQFLSKFVQSTFQASTDNIKFQCLCDINSVGMEDLPSESSGIQTYRRVVLGGTFDRLHLGHKILLGEGCLFAEENLTVGVTTGEMNLKKSLPELIQPTPVRIDSVVQFIETVKPQIGHRVVPITDMFGPTITDPDLQCIVVSDETKKGGDIVNQERQKKGYSALDVYVIDLVQDQCHGQFEEAKISSSSLRKRLLGTLINPVKPNKSIPSSPYVLGLTGGIASGKSAICKRLEGLGAGTVDCDKLGHQAYAKGTVGYDKVVGTFGSGILNSDGEVNRRSLGAIVFSDETKMQTLNKIVWPEIAKLATEEVKKFGAEGKAVVVLEAAILLRAGWEEHCHEVWGCVIPVKEAVKRLHERNNLSEEEAMKRIHLGVTNSELVSKSNVILCSEWEYEYTQQQVEKAWSLLMERLHPTVKSKH
uniref:Bifunctional coenzyme A synthase n=1 Tax=Magallana gigas TaxID=29159 RepID=K1QXH1_MAGGI|eukprot:XP_011422578.1 PREDICTED: bifunctional coenzyme A synthase [Crassostrea gigas]